MGPTPNDCLRIVAENTVSRGNLFFTPLNITQQKLHKAAIVSSNKPAKTEWRAHSRPRVLHREIRVLRHDGLAACHKCAHFHRIHFALTSALTLTLFEKATWLSSGRANAFG